MSRGIWQTGAGNLEKFATENLDGRGLSGVVGVKCYCVIRMCVMCLWYVDVRCGTAITLPPLPLLLRCLLVKHQLMTTLALRLLWSVLLTYLLTGHVAGESSSVTKTLVQKTCKYCRFWPLSGKCQEIDQKSEKYLGTILRIVWLHDLQIL